MTFNYLFFQSDVLLIQQTFLTLFSSQNQFSKAEQMLMIFNPFWCFILSNTLDVWIKFRWRAWKHPQNKLKFLEVLIRKEWPKYEIYLPKYNSTLWIFLYVQWWDDQARIGIFSPAVKRTRSYDPKNSKDIALLLV